MFTKIKLKCYNYFTIIAYRLEKKIFLDISTEIQQQQKYGKHRDTPNKNRMCHIAVQLFYHRKYKVKKSSHLPQMR